MTNIAHLDTSALDTAAKFFRTMQKAGADFTGPMQSVVQRRNLVAYLTMGCPKIDNNGTVVTNLPEGENLARLVLSDDFLSPEEMAKAYGWSYSDEQMAHFAETLPDFETLLWLRANGYLLYATPPTDTNLFQVRDLDNQLFYSKSEDWYDESQHTFSREDVVKAGEWLTVLKEPYPDSLGKTWDEQQALLTEVEHVPNAVEMVYAVTAYYKVRGVYFIEGVHVRTSSVDATGRCIIVGDLSGAGLGVGKYWGGRRNNYIGVSSSRKLAA